MPLPLRPASGGAAGSGLARRVEPWVAGISIGSGYVGRDIVEPLRLDSGVFAAMVAVAGGVMVVSLPFARVYRLA